MADTIESLAEEIRSLKKEIEELRATRPALTRRPLFGGRKGAIPMIDTKTDIVYHSKAAVGKELAAEAGTTAKDQFSWYKLSAKFPNRFREANTSEILAAKEKGYFIQEE